MLGLLALPFGIFAPFAIFSGARSLSRIRRSHGEVRGAARAAAGLAAGIVSLAMLVAVALYWALATS